MPILILPRYLTALFVIVVLTGSAATAATIPASATEISHPSARSSPPMVDPTSGVDWKAFAPRGADGTVRAAVAYDANNIYIGGDFSTVDGVPASGVAHWNGTRWTGIGGGIEQNADSALSRNYVTALAVDQNGNLYIAGHFSRAGTVAAHNIARWDGVRWSALGTGVSGNVYSLAVRGSELFVGGEFERAGGVSAHNIARWDGRQWHAMAAGSGGPVESMAVVNDETFYALGWFQSAHSGMQSQIGRWDGTAWDVVDDSQWNYLDVITAGDALYVAGRDTDSRMAAGRWDGTTWRYFGGFPGTIAALAVTPDGRLFASEYWDDDPNREHIPRHIYRWNGRAWIVAGNRLNGAPHTDELVFTDRAGNVYASDQPSYDYFWSEYSSQTIARLNDSRWETLSSPEVNGLDRHATSFATNQRGDLYVAGLFTYAGDQIVNSVARWDGTRWWPLGNGINFYHAEDWTLDVRAVAVDADDNVYVGGQFTHASGVAAQNIARWDGTRWTALGEGVASWISDIAVDRSGNVYVPGRFKTATDTEVVGIGRWDGNRWTMLGAGTPFGTRGEDTLTIDEQGRIFAVGTFASTSEAHDSLIWIWDGTAWMPIEGTSRFEYVTALVPDNQGGLYVAGGLALGDEPVRTRVVHWDGTVWTPVESNSTQSARPTGVFSLVMDRNGDLYVAGYFRDKDGELNSGVLRWDGVAWVPVLSQQRSFDAWLGIAGDSLFAGGYFDYIGDKPTGNLAQLDLIRPVPTLDASLFDFDAVPVSSASPVLTTTLTNRGNAPFPVGRFAITGTDAAAFSTTTNCRGTLAVGASCRVGVTFRPAHAGEHTAQLAILDAAGVSRSRLSLGGVGTVPRVVSDVAELDFGAVPVRMASSPLTVTLTNEGAAPLTGARHTLTGTNAAAFRTTSDCAATLAPNATCQIVVSFLPSHAGFYRAELTATDRAGTTILRVPLLAEAVPRRVYLPLVLTARSN